MSSPLQQQELMQHLRPYMRMITTGCGNYDCPNMSTCVSAGAAAETSAQSAVRKAITLFRQQVPLCAGLAAHAADSSNDPAKVESKVPEPSRAAVADANVMHDDDTYSKKATSATAVDNNAVEETLNVEVIEQENRLDLGIFEELLPATMSDDDVDEIVVESVADMIEEILSESKLRSLADSFASGQAVTQCRLEFAELERFLSLLRRFPALAKRTMSTLARYSISARMAHSKEVLARLAVVLLQGSDVFFDTAHADLDTQTRVVGLVAQYTKTDVIKHTTMCVRLDLHPSEILNTVRRLQQLLTLCVHGDRLVRTNIEPVLRALELLYEAAVGTLTGRPRARRSASAYHELEAEYKFSSDAVMKRVRADERGQLVSYTEFYSSAMGDVVDWRADFGARLQQNRRMAFRPSGTQEGFAVSDFTFLLDPAAKAEVMQLQNALQQNTQLRQSLMRGGLFGAARPYCVLSVYRENLVPSTLTQLSRMSNADLLKPLKVHFVGEEGVDEGGVRKEFFALIFEKLFDPAFGMFKFNEDTRTYWFQPDNFSFEGDVEFEAIGKLVGLAVFNGVLLDLNFPRLFYKKLLREPASSTSSDSSSAESESRGEIACSLKDLAEFDPELASGLQKLLEYNEGSVEDVFCRTFAVSFEKYGAPVVVSLIPDGDQVPVTEENREDYVKAYLDWFFHWGCEKRFEAFKRGLRAVAAHSDMWKHLRAEELEQMILGNPALDFNALKSSARYDGYSPDDEVVQWLWELLISEFDAETQKKFLEFATGSSRAPVRGLGDLRMVIVKNGNDLDGLEARLPTAHTCFNALMIPQYRNKDKLRRLLLLAIQNSRGFGLK
ncbi:MAG: hypothetical protein MHM6MM_003478 [Cercozoa sp. M6MM]